MNQLLTICIPTYNRSKKLEKNLRHLIKIIGDQKICICISDNASIDDTENVINEIKKSYPYIRYNRNRNNLGFSGNFSAVLKMSNTKYAWLLGDDDYITFNGINCVLEVVKKNLI